MMGRFILYWEKKKKNLSKLLMMRPYVPFRCVCVCACV